MLWRVQSRKQLGIWGAWSKQWIGGQSTFTITSDDVQKKFYPLNIEMQGIRFHHLITIMDEEYNSVLRQNITEAYLYTPRNIRTMTNNKILLNRSKTCMMRGKYTPQASRLCRGNKSKLEYL